MPNSVNIDKDMKDRPRRAFRWTRDRLAALRKWVSRVFTLNAVAVSVGLLLVICHVIARPLLLGDCQPSMPCSAPALPLIAADGSTQLPPEASIKGTDAEHSRGFRHAVQRFFDRWPEDPWHRLSLFALLLSIFSASVLYCGFPLKYELLSLGWRRRIVLQWVIPALQNLAVVVASTQVEHPKTHVGASFAYLGLFVAWDTLVLVSKPKASLTHHDDAEAWVFLREVEDYLTKVDVPATVALLVLLYTLPVLSTDGHHEEAFIAGILSFQSFSAFLNMSFDLGLKKPFYAIRRWLLS